MVKKIDSCYAKIAEEKFVGAAAKQQLSAHEGLRALVPR